MNSNKKHIVLVGHPNVGKSVLFQCLTGTYATVSNYPGTTVEVTRGEIKTKTPSVSVTDTPGMYSLNPITEEERVTRNILLKEKSDLIIHVVDAKNLERMLGLTLELMDAGMPVVLVLNIMDEAEKSGVRIDVEALRKQVGIPVVETISTQGKGIKELIEIIMTYVPSESNSCSISPDTILGKKIAGLADLLEDRYRFSLCLTAVLLMQEDPEILDLVKEYQPSILPEVNQRIREIKNRFVHPVEYEIAVQRNHLVTRIISQTVDLQKKKTGFRERLSRMMMNPFAGIPILLLVLYFGLYRFVGVFGAGTVVDFIEGTIFEGYINPFFTVIIHKVIPWPFLQSLFVGDYGILTLGVRYAVALLLPIVTFFFLVFSILEDSGYLPRLAMLIDRIFKKIGLSGRAVIPMVLGFGCDTMATMVTRTLPSARERVISTILLALAVPCSAQLGVIMALLGERPLGLLIWAGVLMLVFLLIGALSAKILPGNKPVFYMEIPPLRFPKISNVIFKTWFRVKWYFLEVMPLFVLVSALIWVGQLTGIFRFLVHVLEGPVKLIGLPKQAAEVFLFGFFRRDYGVAALYDLNKAGLLDGVQMVVGAVALTLFLPCVAQFMMTVKERGWKIGISISVFVLFFSFIVAFGLHHLLRGLGVVV